MTHEGLVTQVGDWLESQSKDFRLLVLMFTFVLVVFVHGFLLRQLFGFYEGLNAFGWFYLEFVVSLCFGGPICWFVVALLSYLMDG